MYDITYPETFARAKSWVRELQRQASPNIVIALVGNKLDLEGKRAVPFDVRRFARLAVGGAIAHARVARLAGCPAVR